MSYYHIANEVTVNGRSEDLPDKVILFELFAISRSHCASPKVNPHNPIILLSHYYYDIQIL